MESLRAHAWGLGAGRLRAKASEGYIIPFRCAYFPILVEWIPRIYFNFFRRRGV